MKTEEHTDSRKFKIYNVGLAKTGTTSIANIFGNYQSGHEFLLKETGQVIKDFQNNQITQADLRDFVKQRDEIGNLEVDSTFCNSYYLDILAEEFSSAQFIFTIRDCYSWVDSVINMVYTHTKITHLDLIFGLPPSLLGNEAELRKHFYQYLDQLLALWASVNTEILEKLPGDRSLIIRTHEISKKLDDIAGFIGIPADTLDYTKSHEFKAAQKLNLLHEVDYSYLEARFKAYCLPLMNEYFPGYSLKDFLDGDPVPK
jgi:hypothetical protein